MLLTPSTPESLVTSPPGQSSRKRSSKRHRGLALLRSHIQSVANPPESPPLTPSPPGEFDSAVNSSSTTNSNTDASASSSGSSGQGVLAVAPPSIQRPAEDQTVGYFPDLNSHASLLDRTLHPIDEDSECLAVSPGALSTTSAGSAGSTFVSRSMARRRAGSFTSNILGANTRNSHREPSNPRTVERESTHTPSIRPTESSSAITMPANAADDSSKLTGLPNDQMPTIRFIPHQDPRSNKPSLAFTAASRTLPHEACVIRVGRYSERDTSPSPPANNPSAAPVGFKSKVVSRKHCEFWCSQGQWYVKDVKSSSGTFLNHIRLSQPSTESRPFPINDGDIIQLGMDFRGGEESIFRCVKIRIECNRAWQKSLNNFNVATHKQLRALQSSKESDAISTNSTECSICLMSISPCQSLFVAPCSHVWHFKCIRPILNNEKLYPQFLCPNCRAVADLEADIEETVEAEAWEDADDGDAASVTDEHPPTVDGSTITADSSVEHDGNLTDLTSRLRLSEPSPLPPLSAIGAHSTPQRARRSASGSMGGDTTEIGESLSAAQTAATNDSRLRDPRSAMETLGGVVTPRNEAGPFVFDGGAGRARMPGALATSAASG